MKKVAHPPVVFDAIHLQHDPINALQRLCQALSIPFDKNMLSWEKGGIPEDGVWADVWYKNVHQTTGFEKRYEVLPDLQIGAEESVKNYLIMKRDAIKMT